MRSPTAADIGAEWEGYATDFAGLSKDADENLSQEQIDWAAIVAVMGARQAKRLKKLFGPALRRKKVVTLGVPDKFKYMDEDLVVLLGPKLERML